MNYNTATLGNGLRIIHLPTTSRVLYCGYGIMAGSRNELPGEEGIAHFCEHATFKGTSTRKAAHISSCLERVGGDLNAFTNKEITMYHAAVGKEHVARAVDLLTDIVFRSTYPQAELDKEVEVICDEIESYNDSPAELIYEEFEALLFKGHPLGHNVLGNANQLRTYTRDNLKRFTDRYYNTGNAVFFASGDIDFGKLVRLLERKTADCPSRQQGITEAGGFYCCCGDVAREMSPYEPQEKVVDKSTHQAHVLIGNRAYQADDDRRYALTLLDNIIGGPGMNARLNMVLRERNALVYTVYSNFLSYTDTGVWCVYFGCDPNDVALCRRLVRRELDRLASHPLSPSALSAAKRQLRGQISVALDHNGAVAVDFAKQFLKYGVERDYAAYLDKIDALTPADLLSAAQDIFNPERLTTLIFK